jgi:hypothetical protein
VINRSESALIAQERRNQASRAPKTPNREAAKAAKPTPRRKTRTTH